MSGKIPPEWEQIKVGLYTIPSLHHSYGLPALASQNSMHEVSVYGGRVGKLG